MIIKKRTERVKIWTAVDRKQGGGHANLLAMAACYPPQFDVAKRRKTSPVRWELAHNRKPVVRAKFAAEPKAKVQG